MISDSGLHSSRRAPAWLILLVALTILTMLPGELALADGGDGSEPTDSKTADTTPAPASSDFDWSRPGEITFDVLVLRPLGFAASCVGVGAFAVSAPMLAPTTELGTSWEIFVLAPVEYTFERPIGIF